MGGLKKNYETYNRSTRVLFSNKCLPQVTLNKFQTNLNYFDLSYPEAISSNFGLSRYISAGYLRFTRAVRINHQEWIIKHQNSIAIYQVSIINDQVSIIKYELLCIKYELLCIKYKSSSINYQILIIMYQLSTIKYQLSSINC